MNLTRRDTLALGIGAVAGIFLPKVAMASIDEAISAFTGGVQTSEGNLELKAPEIAENGNTVPISVNASGAVAIMVLATGNPNPGVATFKFGPLSGEQSASTRIRLAETQDVIAIAQLADGSFIRTSQEVKVTIGGCGG